MQSLDLHQARQCSVLEVLVPILNGVLEGFVLGLEGLVKVLSELVDHVGAYVGHLDVDVLLEQAVAVQVLTGYALHGVGLGFGEGGHDEEADGAALPVGGLHEDLDHEEKHAFFEVKRPNVNSSSMLDIIIKRFLRLQHSEHMSERVSMLYHVYKPIRLQLIVLPLIRPR